ncbi:MULTISPECIES: hypothetical protein [Rhodomicrobium]|uniref:hypothetical protein n=1 Tax=Rhodomicrobium TaxID=1068 RepID=UPI000B4B35F9|nr:MULTISPECIES: hypothetical protein [Rhodomicrobium]
MKSRLIGLAATVFTPFIMSDAAAARLTEIPSRFQGAGCNLKYSYARKPKADASDCVSAKAENTDGAGHDNAIRITGSQVQGPKWACTVKSIEKLTKIEISFTADCSAENTPYSSTITLIRRPGKRMIVQQVVSGRYTLDIYHLRAASH